jgi:hypothetical protein
MKKRTRGTLELMRLVLIRPRSRSASILYTALLGALSACGGQSATGDGAMYREYECPAPIGKIVQEDCSHLGLRYDGVTAKGSAGAAGVAEVSGEYRDQATREANSMIQVLKDQRVALCHDFNTCKLNVTEYRGEQRRIDDTFSMILTLTERLPHMSAAEVQSVLQQLREVRGSAGAASASAPPAPATGSGEAGAGQPAPQQGRSQAELRALIEGWNPGKFMLQAVARVAGSARDVEQRTPLGFDRDHACLLGAFVTAGQTRSLWQTFTPGITYALLGAGEENAIDVDLAIADESGKILVADTQDDAVPLVKFVPPAEGRYEIRLGLARSSASGSFVALAVMQQGGYSIPADRIIESLTNALAYGAFASQRSGSGLVFHEGDDWSFFSTVLEPRQASSFGGIKIPGQAIALAAGDSRSQDLDIQIEEGGRVVGADKDDDPIPNVQLRPGDYKVTVENPRSNGATLVTLLLLDAPR